MKLLAAAAALLVLSADAFSPNVRRSVSSSSSSIKISSLDRIDEVMDQIDGVQDSINVKNSPRWRKKTKQLATLGPASSSFEMIEKLFLAGECYLLFIAISNHILSLVL